MSTPKNNLRYKLAVFELLGNKCKHCGYDKDHRALQVDHINRAKEPRSHTLRSGIGLYLAILRGDKNLAEFQLLCANCNWIKKLENNENTIRATSTCSVANKSSQGS